MGADGIGPGLSQKRAFLAQHLVQVILRTSPVRGSRKLDLLAEKRFVKKNHLLAPQNSSRIHRLLLTLV